MRWPGFSFLAWFWVETFVEVKTPKASFEPGSQPWQGCIIPLSLYSLDHQRIIFNEKLFSKETKKLIEEAFLFWFNTYQLRSQRVEMFISLCSRIV